MLFFFLREKIWKHSSAWKLQLPLFLESYFYIQFSILVLLLSGSSDLGDLKISVFKFLGVYIWIVDIMIYDNQDNLVQGSLSTKSVHSLSTSSIEMVIRIQMVGRRFLSVVILF